MERVLDEEAGAGVQPATGVAYASSSLALAAMEYFVNLDPRDAPADLVAIKVEIPDHVTTERIAIAELPDNWKQRPYSTKLQQIGAAWLSSRFSVCLIVPSVVIPQENNLLINPDHPDFSKLILQPPSGFTFDPRLWK